VRRGLALASLIILATAALCVRLGIWQLGRYERKKTLNAARATALATPPERWDGVAGAARLLGRRVIVSGRYDASPQVLLAFKERDETPGVEVVTPLVLAGGRRVLVDRGWLPSDDAVHARPQDFPEPGVVEVVGVAESLGRGSSMFVLEDDSVRVLSARALDADSVRARLGGVIAPLLVRQLPGADVPRRPRRIAPQPLETGMHLSYAIQWFVIAAVALFGGVAFLRARAREGV